MLALIMITSSVEGVVYLNGHFAGEVREDAPIYRPIRPYGALFIEHKPLTDGYLPLARRLAFSAGRLVASSVECAPGLNCVMWPFGITEIELVPEAYAQTAPETYALNDAGRAYRLIRVGNRARLEIDADGVTSAFPLPDGAKPPVFAEGDGRMYLSGDTDAGERYALALSRDGKSLLFSEKGAEVAFLGEGRIAVTEKLKDSAGRARRTVYAAADGAYEAISREILPPKPGDFSPQTPLALALAAIEAKQLELDAEAQSYFVPGAHMDEDAARVCAETAGASAMRFLPPDGENVVCALKFAGERLIEAVPLYYRAETFGGAWRLVSLRVNST